MALDLAFGSMAVGLAVASLLVMWTAVPLTSTTAWITILAVAVVGTFLLWCWAGEVQGSTSIVDAPMALAVVPPRERMKYASESLFVVTLVALVGVVALGSSRETSQAGQLLTGFMFLTAMELFTAVFTERLMDALGRPHINFAVALMEHAGVTENTSFFLVVFALLCSFVSMLAGVLSVMGWVNMERAQWNVGSILFCVLLGCLLVASVSLRPNSLGSGTVEGSAIPHAHEVHVECTHILANLLLTSVVSLTAFWTSDGTSGLVSASRIAIGHLLVLVPAVHGLVRGSALMRLVRPKTSDMSAMMNYDSDDAEEEGEGASLTKQRVTSSIYTA